MYIYVMCMQKQNKCGAQVSRGEEPAEIFWLRAGTGLLTKTSRAAAARE